MASSKSEDIQPSSYTNMDGDVEAIGAHCQYEFCNLLDFLPFRCGSCKGTFCLDHRTETAHKCPNEGAWAAARRKATLGSPNGSNNRGKTTMLESTCASPKCTSKINTPLSTGVLCSTCNRMYCLKHRMNEDHNCKNLVPLGARPTSATTVQTDKAMHAFARFKAWGKDKKASIVPVSTPKPNSNAARIIAINNLRKIAKGEGSIPTEKRIYLYVEAEAASTTSKFPKGEFFYNKDWSIGRVLDMAAKSLQVQNVNNRGDEEEQKLRVFYVEGGRLLEFSEKLGESTASGNTLVLLRGVGPAVPDLIEV